MDDKGSKQHVKVTRTFLLGKNLSACLETIVTEVSMRTVPQLLTLTFHEDGPSLRLFVEIGNHDGVHTHKQYLAFTLKIKKRQNDHEKD